MESRREERTGRHQSTMLSGHRRLGEKQILLKNVSVPKRKPQQKNLKQREGPQQLQHWSLWEEAENSKGCGPEILERMREKYPAKDGKKESRQKRGDSKKPNNWHLPVRGTCDNRPCE